MQYLNFTTVFAHKFYI